MRKLLYIAFNNRENTLFGVRAKILSQCRVFGEWGYSVDLIERCGPETVVMMENGETVLLRVPADESPINMEKVLAFYDQCYGDGRTRAQVGTEIRNYIEARSGMKETLRRVVDALNGR